MKVNIAFISSDEEESVDFKIHQMTKTVNDMIQLASAQGSDVKYIVGKNEDKLVKLKLEDIFYVEVVDKKTFAYMMKDTYEIQEKLYEVEEKTSAYDYLRISKSMVVNFSKIEAFYPKLSGNMEIALENGEKLIVSRRYVMGLKNMLGMGE